MSINLAHNLSPGFGSLKTGDGAMRDSLSSWLIIMESRSAVAISISMLSLNGGQSLSGCHFCIPLTHARVLVLILSLRSKSLTS